MSNAIKMKTGVEIDRRRFLQEDLNGITSEISEEDTEAGKTPSTEKREEQINQG